MRPTARWPATLLLSIGLGCGQRAPSGPGLEEKDAALDPPAETGPPVPDARVSPQTPDAAGPADAPALAEDAAPAGPVDAAPTSGDGAAPGTGGPALECKFHFCESFEDAADGAPPNPAVWTRTNTDMVVSAARAARGTKSLHVGPLTGGNHFIRESRSFPVMNGAYFGRMFLWVERFPVETPQPPTTVYHWTFLEASGSPEGGGFVVRLGGHNRTTGQLFLRLNIEPHTAMPETGLFDKNHGMQAKRWYCVEFFMDASKNEARFWFDGVETPDLHWQNTMPSYKFPDFRSLSFGWTEYQGTKTPYEAYIDEIALDTRRVGCAE